MPSATQRGIDTYIRCVPTLAPGEIGSQRGGEVEGTVGAVAVESISEIEQIAGTHSEMGIAVVSIVPLGFGHLSPKAESAHGSEPFAYTHINLRHEIVAHIVQRTTGQHDIGSCTSLDERVIMPSQRAELIGGLGRLAAPMIGVGKTSQQGWNNIHLATERAGMLGITVIVEVNTRFDSKRQFARQAQIGLQAQTAAEHMLVHVHSIGGVVVAHASHSIEPEPAVGVDAAESIVQIEHIVELTANGLHPIAARLIDQSDIA